MDSAKSTHRWIRPHLSDTEGVLLLATPSKTVSQRCCELIITVAPISEQIFVISERNQDDILPKYVFSRKHGYGNIAEINIKEVLGSKSEDLEERDIQILANNISNRLNDTYSSENILFIDTQSLLREYSWETIIELIEMTASTFDFTYVYINPNNASKDEIDEIYQILGAKAEYKYKSNLWELK